MGEVLVNYTNVRIFIAVEVELAKKLQKLIANQKSIVTATASDIKTVCLENVQLSNQIKALCAEQSKLISMMSKVDIELIKEKATKQNTKL